MGRLEGKVAIITGASLNIGGTVARFFAREGAKVACNDIKPEVAQQSADRVTEEGGDAMAIPGDVTDETYVKAAVEKVVAKWGKADVLVNAAMIVNRKGVIDMPYEEYLRQLEVIQGGAFLFTKYVAQSLIDRELPGSIINIISTAGWQGEPGNIGYSTAKSGMINFTRSAAMELAEYGIRVNMFTPTATQPIDPAIIDRYRNMPAFAGRSTKFANQFLRMTPSGRLPTPEDHAPAFVFLASDESSMMTGTEIRVDGGVTAKYWPWIPGEQAGQPGQSLGGNITAPST